MRPQLFFLMCLVTKGLSLTCNVCDSGSFSTSPQHIQIDSTLQNKADCTNAMTGAQYQTDCSTVGIPALLGGTGTLLPKYYCVRIDYTNTTSGSTGTEVMRTCAPAYFSGKICTVLADGITELCGYATSCSGNNCNSQAYTGVNPEATGQCNGGSSIISMGHLLMSVVGMSITLFLYH